MNVDITDLKIIDIKHTNSKLLTGSITFCRTFDDKAKSSYALDHKALSHAATLSGYPVIATLNPERRMIVNIRPME